MLGFLRQPRQQSIIEVSYFSEYPELQAAWDSRYNSRNYRLFTDRYWLLMGSNHPADFEKLGRLLLDFTKEDSSLSSVGVWYNDSGIQLHGRNTAATAFTLLINSEVPPNAEAITDDLLTVTNAELEIRGSELTIPLGPQVRASVTV